MIPSQACIYWVLVFFPVIKRPECETDLSPYSDEIKNKWSCTRTSICLYDLYRDEFALYNDIIVGLIAIEIATVALIKFKIFPYC